MARSGERSSAPELGRYVLGDEIASGGMAVVHLGRMLGPGGFVRTVAIKRLHASYAMDPEFVSMFFDEARLAARVQHPNVVSTLDVVEVDGELFLVMEYVRGESLAELERAAHDDGEAIPIDIALGIMSGVLCGLHAAHEAKTERGEALAIIHRDVSPQNVLVGDDGVARVLDFGIAKAKFRAQTTQDGRLKGKLRYVAPEQLRRAHVDRRCDVYAASLVLWEMVTARRCFDSDEPRELFDRILAGDIAPPRSIRPALPETLDAIVMRGLARDPERRFPTALAMAEALEGVGAAATPRQIGAWVQRKAQRRLDERAAKVVELESSSDADAEAARAGKRIHRRAPSHLETDVGVDDSLPTSGPLFAAAHAAPQATPVGAPPRRRAWAGVAVALAFAALGAVALGALGATTSAAPAAPAAATSAAPAPAVADSSESARIEPTAETSSVALPVSPAPPPPIAPAPEAARTTTTRSAPAAPPRARPGKPAHGACDTPYFVDAEGHKQFKARCL